MMSCDERGQKLPQLSLSSVAYMFTINFRNSTWLLAIAVSCVNRLFCYPTDSQYKLRNDTSDSIVLAWEGWKFQGNLKELMGLEGVEEGFAGDSYTNPSF